ncbi:MAG: ABC transporter ATP-binding protein [Candidatus Omnitrophica bacterium]|nr:ABC transporter ATP-binding protein [Candidatus Omnitrophota bacterium]
MLEVQNIFKSYTDTQKRVDVLKGVSLSVTEGESVAIVGPSGAGKSTLLHIAGGLDRPNAGTVVFKGQDVYRLSDVERSAMRNASVGFVFQFYHLLGDLTALENVMLPLIVKGNPGGKTRELEDKARKRLVDVGLGERADHKPNQLSGGEQQRVAVARALINDPALLLCDEPTGNLDSASGNAVIDLLFRLNAAERRTVVIVTHDESLARRASRIVHIKDGILV